MYHTIQIRARSILFLMSFLFQQSTESDFVLCIIFYLSESIERGQLYILFIDIIETEIIHIGSQSLKADEIFTDMNARAMPILHSGPQ